MLPSPPISFKKKVSTQTTPESKPNPKISSSVSPRSTNEAKQAPTHDNFAYTTNSEANEQEKEKALFHLLEAVLSGNATIVEVNVCI